MLSLQRGLVVAALTLAGLAPAIASANDDSVMVPVVTSLHRALATRDVETTASLFAEDAVVVQLTSAGAAPRVFVGREQIRWWARSLGEQNARLEIVDEAGVRLEGVDQGGARLEGGLTWQGSFAADPLRNVGIDALATTGEVTIQDGALTSLTIVPTPAGARQLSGAVQGSRAVDLQSEPPLVAQIQTVQLGGMEMALPLTFAFALGALAMLGLLRNSSARTI